MPVDGDVPWECTPHTKVKHDIYRRYLERWYPILMNGPKAYASVTYAEGFAGPGIYTGGEPGSPVIAMKALVDKVPPDRGVARFLFIDDDQRCVDMLGEQLLAAFPQRPRPNHTMPAVRIKRERASSAWRPSSQTCRPGVSRSSPTSTPGGTLQSPTGC